ncbi:MAG: hypothetical protein R8K20_08925 [Gallionellaceae bacterium]
MTSLKVLRSMLWLSMMLLSSVLWLPSANAADAPQKSDSIQLMETFASGARQAEDSNVLKEHEKHVIMFMMGVPLLLLILITGGLGVAMVVYGKQVFMLHMIFAGFTVTLALAHLVTGLVWFYPF